MDPGDIDLGYVFFPDYVDYCHPNHPDCVTGVTCANCDQGFNPHLVVACNLVSFSEMPLITSVEDPVNNFYTELLPNPTMGLVELTIFGSASIGPKTIDIFNSTGGMVNQFETQQRIFSFDMSDLPAGLYFVKIQINGKTEVKKIVVQ